MNQEFRDQLTDEITKEMYGKNWMSLIEIQGFVSKSNLAFALEEDAIRFYESVVEYMTIKSLISSVGADTNAKQLTLAGKVIVENGGWLEYLKAKDLKENAEIGHQLRQMKLSEWQVKTRWLPFVISGIALIVSIAALVKSYKTDNQFKPQENSDAVVQPVQSTMDSVKQDTTKTK